MATMQWLTSLGALNLSSSRLNSGNSSNIQAEDRIQGIMKELSFYFIFFKLCMHSWITDQILSIGTIWNENPKTFVLDNSSLILNYTSLLWGCAEKGSGPFLKSDQTSEFLFKSLLGWDKNFSTPLFVTNTFFVILSLFEPWFLRWEKSIQQRTPHPSLLRGSSFLQTFFYSYQISLKIRKVISL